MVELEGQYDYRAVCILGIGDPSYSGMTTNAMIPKDCTLISDLFTAARVLLVRVSYRWG